MKIYAAPVQGHTDAPYRHFLAEVYGAPNLYVTPFIRLEHGDVRKRDLADVLSPLNEGTDLRPQVIFRDELELSELVRILKEHGVKDIDVNMCCPFPLQTARGRGAAAVGRPECAEALRKVVEGNPDLSFSVKLRLGYDDPHEWRALMPVLNDLNLDHVTLHARVAKEQYGGEVHTDEFAAFLEESRNPVVWSGDVHTPEDFGRISSQFPDLDGIMLGRGLLGRPSLAAEVAGGAEWDRVKRIRTMLEFHDLLFDHYKETLVGGDHQVLSKILPFWEYAEEEIGRKAWKGIRKASNMAKYHTALAGIKTQA